MVNKKPSKSVLDYDPLAWLAEDDDPTEETQKVDMQPVAKKVASKKAVTRKLATKKAVTKKATIKKTVSKKAPVKKANSSEKSLKKTVTEKPVLKDDEVTNIEAKEMNDSNEEEQGFGFFEDAPGTGLAKPDKASEEGQSFGFFDEVTEGTTAQAEGNSDEDQGYGFFDSSEQLTTQSVELDEATNIINLGAELTIRSVGACKQLIDGNLSNGFDVKLAAGDLQKIDTAGLQLIYSLNKYLEKTSRSITWESSNSIINDAALLIGLPKLLESSDDEGSYGFF